jgi:hypothetical protein
MKISQEFDVISRDNTHKVGVHDLHFLRSDSLIRKIMK